MAFKLLQIRTALGLTQDEMLKRLNYRKSPLYASQISDFEQGKREPPVQVLLRYARVAGVPMEMLVDDALDLPNRLPSVPEYEWVMRRVRTGRQ
ncbi:MAG TPA: helix-turn-helix transcriptional regulator [Pyrinomonadaceae bacterium]|jgi:transcriptional regulator with XRE-family HTH domain